MLLEFITQEREGRVVFARREEFSEKKAGGKGGGGGGGKTGGSGNKGAIKKRKNYREQVRDL